MGLRRSSQFVNFMACLQTFAMRFSEVANPSIPMIPKKWWRNRIVCLGEKWLFRNEWQKLDIFRFVPGGEMSSLNSPSLRLKGWSQSKVRLFWSDFWNLRRAGVHFPGLLLHKTSLRKCTLKPSWSVILLPYATRSYPDQQVVVYLVPTHVNPAD